MHFDISIFWFWKFQPATCQFSELSFLLVITPLISKQYICHFAKNLTNIDILKYNLNQDSYLTFFVKVTTRQQQIASKFIILWIICPHKRWLQTVSLSYKKIAIIQKDETTARWSGYKKCSTRVCFRFEFQDGLSNKRKNYNHYAQLLTRLEKPFRPWFLTQAKAITWPHPEQMQIQSMLSGVVGGKTSKISVLPWFSNLEANGGTPRCYGGLSLPGAHPALVAPLMLIAKQA